MATTPMMQRVAERMGDYMMGEPSSIDDIAVTTKRKESSYSAPLVYNINTSFSSSSSDNNPLICNDFPSFSLHKPPFQHPSWMCTHSNRSWGRALHVFKTLTQRHDAGIITLSCTIILLSLGIGFLIGFLSASSIRSQTRRRSSSSIFETIFSKVSYFIGAFLFQSHSPSTLRDAKHNNVQKSTFLTVPKHMAVIMDGNRRFGIKTYRRAYQGHVDGAKKLTEFITWCIEQNISILTVYAFSTENWDRDPEEIKSLFSIVHSYCDDIQTQALKHGIRVHRFTTQEEKIPTQALQRLDLLVQETSTLTNPVLDLNICFSYGSRGEIVQACKRVCQKVLKCHLPLEDLTEARFHQELLTSSCPDPDVIIRTSGEMRLSNFLLWQSAYSELFFIDKTWPEIEKQDFLQVLDHYAQGRHRRFGK